MKIDVRYGELTIQAPTGRSVHPETGETFPAVILYMDASGIREELKELSRRIAGQGYFCLLPDLYYRLGSIRLDPAKSGNFWLPRKKLGTVVTCVEAP